MLPEVDQQMLRDLMSDAMEEADVHQASHTAKPQPNGKAGDSPPGARLVWSRCPLLVFFHTLQ